MKGGKQPRDDFNFMRSRKTATTKISNSDIKRRKRWLIIPLHHNIARVTRTLKPSNHLPVNAPNAARSKKFFQMNLTGHTPAVDATSPLTLPSVSWKGKVKVFLLAKRLEVASKTHLRPNGCVTGLR